MATPFAAFSASISHLISTAALSLTAIRTGPNRHVTGLRYRDDTIVTTDQALPALDHYTVVLPNGELIAAKPGPRNRTSNIATLQIGSAVPDAVLEVATPLIGSLVLVLASGPDASPTVRLSVVHRFARTEDGTAAVLDLKAEEADQAAVVLDAEGRLIGLVAIGTAGEALVVPAASRSSPPIAPTVGAATARSVPLATPPTAEPAVRRGWLGVALQPITVPDGLAERVGQRSGRMVVGITAGGPAERGGLRIGDVLLIMNDTSVSSPNAMRAFLDVDKIGSTVDVTLLRDGALLTARLVVAAPPG